MNAKFENYFITIFTHSGLSYCRSRGREFLFPARAHTFVEIDREIISTAILLPFTDSRRVVLSCEGRYVHAVLVNRLVKLAQEKSVGRLLTVST